MGLPEGDGKRPAGCATVSRGGKSGSSVSVLDLLNPAKVNVAPVCAVFPPWLRMAFTSYTPSVGGSIINWSGRKKTLLRQLVWLPSAPPSSCHL